AFWAVFSQHLVVILLLRERSDDHENTDGYKANRHNGHHGGDGAGRAEMGSSHAGHADRDHQADANKNRSQKREPHICPHLKPSESPPQPPSGIRYQE
ncbi:MAG: hypothetical protein U9N87_11615, partial [Planctomycetota bacterium]|nr:hypothetical protein [Planctomycetota bacterium]